MTRARTNGLAMKMGLKWIVMANHVFIINVLGAIWLPALLLFWQVNVLGLISNLGPNNKPKKCSMLAPEFFQP
jgi:hypothetical protein